MIRITMPAKTITTTDASDFEALSGELLRLSKLCQQCADALKPTGKSVTREGAQQALSGLNAVRNLCAAAIGGVLAYPVKLEVISKKVVAARTAKSTDAEIMVIANEVVQTSRRKAKTKRND